MMYMLVILPYIVGYILSFIVDPIVGTYIILPEKGT